LGSLLWAGTHGAYAQPLSLSLTPSDYNGRNVSCFGAHDGAIDLEITGGQPPYDIAWSTNETTEDIDSLAAGYYIVRVQGGQPSRQGLEGCILGMASSATLRCRTTMATYK
jgi:hypothetical protein